MWNRLSIRLRKIDGFLFFAFIILACLGLLAIYSVTLSQQATDFLLFKKQLIAFGLGLCLFWFFLQADYRFLKGYHFIFYICANLLLFAVLIFGETIRGTKGWFEFGTISFQPVEFAKICLIVFFASFFAKRSERLLNSRDIFLSFLLILLPVSLVLFQPDTGSAILLLSIWGSLLLFSGISLRSFLFLMGTGVLICLVAWVGFFAEYQKDRIRSVLDPLADPQGQGYNVSQALIAIGSGQWFGRGFGSGSQSQLHFLPESQTDFIFAVIAEELGFMGVLIIFAAFGTLFFRLARAIYFAKDPFASYLLFGIGALFFSQFLINIGMNLGLFPVTGITLPLVSYGGSSLVVSLILMGIAQGVISSISFHQQV